MSSQNQYSVINPVVANRLMFINLRQHAFADGPHKSCHTAILPNCRVAW